MDPSDAIPIAEQVSNLSVTAVLALACIIEGIVIVVLYRDQRKNMVPKPMFELLWKDIGGALQEILTTVQVRKP